MHCPLTALDHPHTQWAAVEMTSQWGKTTRKPLSNHWNAVVETMLTVDNRASMPGWFCLVMGTVQSHCPAKEAMGYVSGKCPIVSTEHWSAIPLLFSSEEKLDSREPVEPKRRLKTIPSPWVLIAKIYKLCYTHVGFLRSLWVVWGQHSVINLCIICHITTQGTASGNFLG